MKQPLKLLSLSLFLSMGINVAAQVEYPLNEDGEGEIMEVVETTMPKETVYKNALEFITGLSGRIIMRDDDNHKLIAECVHNLTPEWKYINVGFGSIGRVDKDEIGYRVTIESKDGRYRVKINHISFTYSIKYKLNGHVSREASLFVGKDNAHNLKYEMAEETLSRLEKKDTSKMNKKDLAKHNEDLKLARQTFEYYKSLNQQEYDTLLGIIASEKKKLAVNDDF